jgi:uncharacterized membrane protein YgcG
LELEKRIEFNEGDVGLAGGVQILEPASANPTTVDIIRRFGGTTNPAVKWPEEDSQGDDDSDRFQRIEDLIKKVADQISKSTSSAKKVKGGGASSSGMSGGAAESGGEGGHGGSEEEGAAAEADAEAEEAIEEE